MKESKFAYGNRFLYFTGREHRQSGDSGVDSAAAGPEGRDERERASQWLAEVGIYDYRNRIYHSELGRFLQTCEGGCFKVVEISFKVDISSIQIVNQNEDGTMRKKICNRGN